MIQSFGAVNVDADMVAHRTQAMSGTVKYGVTITRRLNYGPACIIYFKTINSLSDI